MNIHQDCIISLLDRYGIIPTYMDPHEIGSVTYYFGGKGGISLKFIGSCVPQSIAVHYLGLFSLQQHLHEITIDRCKCNW